MSVTGILSSRTSALAEMFDIKKLMAEGDGSAAQAARVAAEPVAAAGESRAETGQDLVKVLVRGEDPGANDYVPPDQAGRYQGSSLMSRNFFKANYEKSRYTEASISRFGEEQGLRNKLDGVMGSLLNMADMYDMNRNFGNKDNPIDPKYVTATILAAKSGQNVNQVMSGEVKEASDENLEENRERIAERTEAALSPEELLTAAASTEQALAEAPEIASGGGAANPEIPAAQSPPAAASEVYTEIGNLAAPAAGISLNISV